MEISMKVLALGIGFLVFGASCASHAGPNPLSSITQCNTVLLERDAKSRLSEPKPSDEVSYELVVYESRQTLAISYAPKLLSNDPDKLIIRAGGEAAVYDKQSCAFRQMKHWR